MELISLQSQNRTPSLEELFSVQGAVREVIVISAYTDIPSIKQVIGFLSDSADARTKPSLRIYIDKASSKYFSDGKIRHQLLEQQGVIKNRFSDDSGIFLVQFGKLFHSKIYLIEANKYGKIIIGSMNFTQKAVNENEEILLIDNYKLDSRSIGNKLSKWVKEEYLDLLNSKSELIDYNNKVNYPSCMRQLLLNGRIYYELKEQSPFRFKLNLPEQVIKQQAEIDPLLESSVIDTISIVSLITNPTNGLNIKLPNPGTTRAYWKRYCVETCYGYWNPDSLRDDLDSAIKKRVKQRKPYYDKLISIIKERKIDIETLFVALCRRIQDYLDRQGISGWEYSDLDKANEAWNKWLDTLLLKVQNNTFLNRLISGISSVPSPDVWSDPISSDEFENTFLDSIIYYWSKEYSKETSNVIAQAIAWNMDIEQKEKNKIQADTLKDRIENWLLKNPCSDIFDFNDE